MKETQIYLPVSVEQELPKSGFAYFVIADEQEGEAYYHHNGSWLGNHKGRITHWLKSVERFVFTKEELEKVVGEAFDAGDKKYLPNAAQSKQEYITKLLQ